MMCTLFMYSGMSVLIAVVGGCRESLWEEGC